MRGGVIVGALWTVLATAASAAPVLDVSRTVIDFGAHAYVARPQTFVVTNVGDVPWRAAAPALDGRDAALFSVTSSQCPAGALVPPRGRCVFEVGFVPDGHGARQAVARLRDIDAPIALRGMARPRSMSGLGPVALIFSRGVDLAFPLSETVEVSNAGDAPLTLVGLRIEGRQPAEFEIASACALPAWLDLGDHCWITISMTGMGTGPWSSELVVDTAELGTYRLGITGFQPPLPDVLLP